MNLKKIILCPNSRQCQPGMLAWVTASVLTGVVIALHWQLMRSAGPLWRDEVNTVNLSSLPCVAQIWDNAEFDSFPMLWFLVLRAWRAIAGGTDQAYRLLGFLVGLGTVATIWITSRRMGGKVPLLPLALYGLAPEFIRWGDSMRAYGLGVVFAILLVGQFWSATRRRSLPRVVAASLIGLLAVQTLYYNAMLLFAAAAAAACVQARRRNWRGAAAFMAAGIPAAVSLVPYLELFHRVAEWNGLVMVHLTPGWLWFKLGEALASSTPGLLWVWLAAIGLAMIWSASMSFRRRDDAGNSAAQSADLELFCLVAIGLAIPSCLAFLWFLSYPTEPWYYIALAAFCAQCVGAGFTRLRPRMLAIASICLAVYALPGAFGSVSQRQTNLDLICDYLNRNARASDIVLVNPWIYAVTMSRYYHGHAPVYTVPMIDFHLWHKYPLVKPWLSHPDPFVQTRQAIDRTLRGGGCVWTAGYLPDVPGVAPNLPAAPLPDTGWLQSPYESIWAMHLGGYLYSRAAHVSVYVPEVAAVRYESTISQRFEGWRFRPPATQTSADETVR